MRLDLLTKKFTKQLNLYHFLFPYTSEKLLSSNTSKNLDNLFFNLLEELNINFLIECGAYEASASIEAIKRGCKALAIEANPNTFKEITPKSNDKLTSINIGLSDKEEYLNFYFPKEDYTEISSTFQKKDGTIYDTVKVLTQPLDKVIKNYDIITKPFALWIDVEGFQKQVLFGAKNILNNKNCKFLKIEVEKVEKFKGQLFLSKEIEEFLNEYNFIPVFRDFEYDYQFNILFIKEEFYPQFKKKIESLISESTSNSVSLFKIATLLFDRRIFISEMKAFTIRIFGKKIGNYIADFLGSKSSGAYIKRNE